MTENFWLINSNRSRVKRFSKKKQNKDKFYEYMFIDSGRIIGVLGKEPPLMTATVSVEIDLAREIYGRLVTQGWQKIEELLLSEQ